MRFYILTIGIKLFPLNEFLVTCQHRATASDLPFYDIFAPSKNSSFEVSDDVIACDLGPPNQKSWLRLWPSVIEFMKHLLLKR